MNKFELINIMIELIIPSTGYNDYMFSKMYKASEY